MAKTKEWTRLNEKEGYSIKALDGSTLEITWRQYAESKVYSLLLKRRDQIVAMVQYNDISRDLFADEEERNAQILNQRELLKAGGLPDERKTILEKIMTELENHI
jgi:hypothetical protein